MEEVSSRVYVSFYSTIAASPAEETDLVCNLVTTGVVFLLLRYS